MSQYLPFKLYQSGRISLSLHFPAIEIGNGKMPPIQVYNERDQLLHKMNLKEDLKRRRVLVTIVFSQFRVITYEGLPYTHLHQKWRS
jgi:hypothetical protein